MHRLNHMIAVALIALVLVACGAPAAQAPTSAPTTEPTVVATTAVTAAPTVVATAEATATAGITITDAIGSEVVLPQAAQRVVSLAPSITEILFAVGAGPQVVGDTQYCNYPPEADELPEIGGFSAKTISVEAIIALNPDLVIGGSTSQASVAEALAALNVPTVIFDPQTFDDVYANISQIGAATGHSSDAEGVVSSMRERVAAVQAKVENIPNEQRPSVFYEVFDEPLLSAGPGTFIGQMITMLGATNTFGDTSEDYPQVSAEAIIECDPVVIVGPSSHGDKLTAELLAARPGWDQISAVREGRIYLLDGDMASRPGPRLVEVLEAFAAALYPEQFQ